MYGHQVSPHSVIHFYSATKYAVTALTEGLRQELREAQTHIRATVRARPSPAGDRVGAGPPHPARMLLGCTAWTVRGTVLCCCLHDPAQSLPVSAAGADRKGTQWGRLREESKGHGKAWLATQTLSSFLEGHRTLGSSLSPSKPQPSHL